MMNSQFDISFKGVYGCYLKNNRKYAINMKRPNTAVEVIKNDNGLSTLKFYKNFATERESIRTIKNIQGVEIDKIDDESGAIFESDDTFKIKTIEAYDNFLEIGKKAKVLIDKLESCTIFVHSTKGSTEQRALIKDVKGLAVHNQHNDNVVEVYQAQNIVLSNSNVDERINIKADSIHMSGNKKVDLLM